MKILVCIKQILTSDINIDNSGGCLIKGDNSGFAISRFDENALEEAVLIKERLIEKFSSEIFIQNRSDKENIIQNISIDVISVGGVTASESIKRAMGMGADNGIHVVTEDKYYVSGAVTALRLASVIKNIEKTDCVSSSPYDLILTGIMSEDLMQAQVGPTLAEHLNIPYITSVVDIKFDDAVNKLYLQRELEGGVRQNISVKLPALLTIQAGINKPRYPSLSNILRAEKKTITSFNAAEFFSNYEPDSLFNNNVDSYKNITSYINIDPLRFIKFEHPEKKREGRVFNGTAKDKAIELKNILKQKGLLI